MRTLHKAPKLFFAGAYIADLGKTPITPEIEEAAARLKIPFMATEAFNGTFKHTLRCAPPKVVEAWMSHASRSGCAVSGNPEAGTAEAIAPAPISDEHVAQARALLNLRRKP